MSQWFLDILCSIGARKTTACDILLVNDKTECKMSRTSWFKLTYRDDTCHSMILLKMVNMASSSNSLIVIVLKWRKNRAVTGFRPPPVIGWTMIMHKNSSIMQWVRWSIQLMHFCIKFSVVHTKLAHIPISWLPDNILTTYMFFFAKITAKLLFKIRTRNTSNKCWYSETSDQGTPQ